MVGQPGAGRHTTPPGLLARAGHGRCDRQPVLEAVAPAQGLAAGGDFFDVFAISSGTTGIIIGDVSGHGRESLIQAVLARADRYLIGEFGTGFATVIICRYKHATGELTWAKAGHEPPIIAGEPDFDEESATPLGLGLVYGSEAVPSQA